MTYLQGACKNDASLFYTVSLSARFNFVFHFSDCSNPPLLTHLICLQLHNSHLLPHCYSFCLSKRNAQPTRRFRQELLQKPTPFGLDSCYSVKVTVTPTHNGSGCTVVHTQTLSAPPTDCMSLHSCVFCLLSGLWVNTNTAQQDQGMLISPAHYEQFNLSVKETC